VYSLFLPLSVKNFPNSGKQKREQPLELDLHITVLVNGKYTQDLIFKTENSAGLRTSGSSILLQFWFLDDLADPLRKAGIFSWLSPFSTPCSLRYLVPRCCPIPYCNAYTSKSWNKNSSAWLHGSCRGMLHAKERLRWFKERKAKVILISMMSDPASHHGQRGLFAAFKVLQELRYLNS